MAENEDRRGVEKENKKLKEEVVGFSAEREGASTARIQPGGTRRNHSQDDCRRAGNEATKESTELILRLSLSLLGLCFPTLNTLFMLPTFSLRHAFSPDPLFCRFMSFLFPFFSFSPLEGMNYPILSTHVSTYCLLSSLPSLNWSTVHLSGL